MNVLLLEANIKKIAPNIALMKYATWCENNNHMYQYAIGEIEPKFSPDLILMSCIFSFYSKKYKEILDFYHQQYPNALIKVGGPFASNFKEWFNEKVPYVDVHVGMDAEIEHLPMKYSIEPENKKMVMYASRGCPNKCGYCTVPKLEGAMNSFESIKHLIDNGKKEIQDPSGIVLYDNNFTAHEYFDKVCDEIEESGLPIDIHGLHVSAFTEHHAERFARLKWGSQSEKGTAYMRFSFDFLGYQKHILRALKLCEKYKIKAGFFCYMLFNWKDSPDDFWQRIELAQEMTDEVGRTIFLFPQRFEPLDALERNKFVGSKWTEDQVRGVTRLYTYMHGFIPTTSSRNIYNWIGQSKDEFLQHIDNFTQIKGYKLVKGQKPPIPKKPNDIDDLFC